MSQRAQMVLLSMRGKKVPELAGTFTVCAASVPLWIHRFNAYGPPGLYDRERSGRPRKATKEVKDTIRQMIQADPQQEGYQAAFWTVPMLVTALANRLQTAFSPSTIRGTLHQIGLRWGRPRLSMPDKTDPEKAQKQWVIVKAIITAPPEAVILYADECRLHLLPLVCAMWHWVGQQIRIPTPGSNVTRALFGALIIRTARWTYLVRDRMRKEDSIAFLEHLIAVYPAPPIILIVDNCSSHTTHLVRDWLAKQERLHLYDLPKYCSHLNSLESLWLRLKGKIAANRLYGSMQSLLQTAEGFFNQMSAERALTWAAALKCQASFLLGTWTKYLTPRPLAGGASLAPANKRTQQMSYRPGHGSGRIDPMRCLAAHDPIWQQPGGHRFPHMSPARMCAPAGRTS